MSKAKKRVKKSWRMIAAGVVIKKKIENARQRFKENRGWLIVHLFAFLTDIRHLVQSLIATIWNP